MNNAKLGDICELKPKKALVKQKISINDPVSFSPMDQLPVGKKYFTPTDSKKLSSVYSSYVYFQDNDVIYAKITPCFENGKMSIAKDLVNGVGFGSSEFVPIRCSDAIIPEYLYYFLLQPSFIQHASKRMRGASGHRRVPDEITKDLEIPLPDVNEQWRVVKRLDATFEKIDRAIELTEKNITYSRSVFESEFRKIFTNLSRGPQALIKDSTKTGAGGTPNKGHPEYYNNATIPWLRSGEVDKKEIVNSELYISEIGLKNSSAKMFPKNSVLVAMYGATAGQVGILKFESSTNQAICAIYPQENLDPEYVYYALLNQKANLLSQAVGNAQPNVSQIKIKNLKIPKLTLQEQKNVALKIADLDAQTQKLRNVYLNKKDKLTILKQSMLSQAFSESDVK